MNQPWNQVLKSSPKLVILLVGGLMSAGVLGVYFLGPRFQKASSVAGKHSDQARRIAKKKPKKAQNSVASRGNQESASVSLDSLGPAGEEAAAKISDKLPPLQFYNAYRTRYFWQEELLKDSKKQFSVAFRIDAAAEIVRTLSPKLVPVIEWESFIKPGQGLPRQSVAKGQILGSANSAAQVVGLPPAAWRVASSAVDVDLVLKWSVAAPAGGLPSLKGDLPALPTPERATIRIRSVQGLKTQNPDRALLIKLSDKSQNPAHVKAVSPKNAPDTWFTSWGKPTSAPGSMSVLLAPGYSSQLVTQILAVAHDFDLSLVPWSADQGNWSEVWVKGGQAVVALEKTGVLGPATTTAVSEVLASVYPGSLKFRGALKGFACDLKQNPQSVSECLSHATHSVLHLYAPSRNPPFIEVKRDLLLDPPVRDMLSKEGHYLFTQPVNFL